MNNFLGPYRRSFPGLEAGITPLDLHSETRIPRIQTGGRILRGRPFNEGL